MYLLYLLIIIFWSIISYRMYLDIQQVHRYTSFEDQEILYNQHEEEFLNDNATEESKLIKSSEPHTEKSFDDYDFLNNTNL